MSYLLLCFHGPLIRQQGRLQNKDADCSCVFHFACKQLFCCFYCRSAFTEGAFATPSCETYWRGKGKEIAKDFPSLLILFVSLVNHCPSPEKWPCTTTVSVTAATDCSQDITHLLLLQGELRLMGGQFHWSRHGSKITPRTVMATERSD